MLQFFETASFLWVTIIAVNLYVVVVKQFTDIGRLEKYYHAIVWGSSAVFTVVPMFTKSYGFAGLWFFVVK